MKDQKIHETHQEKNGLEKEGFSTTTHNHEAVNKNINLKKETKTMKNFNLSQDLVGYSLVAAGSLLLLYSFGYFQILNWAVMAGSIGLIFWGALKSNLFSKVFTLLGDIFEFIKEKFSSKK